MGRSYVRRGVSVPRWHEPKPGETYYIEGRKVTIRAPKRGEESDYVWFRGAPGGTLGMSLGNFRQIAYYEPRGNPGLLSSASGWIKAKAVRIRKVGGRKVVDILTTRTKRR